MHIHKRMYAYSKFCNYICTHTITRTHTHTHTHTHSFLVLLRSLTKYGTGITYSPHKEGSPVASQSGQTHIQVTKLFVHVMLSVVRYVIIYYICFFADPMHTYLGLCGLSLNGEENIGELNAALNISQRAANWLQKIQRKA